MRKFLLKIPNIAYLFKKNIHVNNKKSYKMTILGEIEQKCNINLSDIAHKIPMQVGEICDRLGIEVIFDKTMPSHYSGQIKYSVSNDKYTIHVNDNHAICHIIFTIAHELGHFIRHKEIVKEKGFVDRKRNDSNEYEREANEFAASLLMPKDKFFELYNSTNGNLSALQEAFKVSLEAIYYRALNLGLLLG